jgi:hypothetical protein
MGSKLDMEDGPVESAQRSKVDFALLMSLRDPEIISFSPSQTSVTSPPESIVICFEDSRMRCVLKIVVEI